MNDKNFVTSATSDELVGYTPTDKPEKEFKQLFGQRVYIELPEMSKSELYLDAKAKEEIRKERAKKILRLKVYAVGAGITHLKEGDEVMIDENAFNPNNPHSKIIELSENRTVLMISVYDVIHLW